MMLWISSVAGWANAGIKTIDQKFDYIVIYALKYSAKNENSQLKFETLKLKNKTLYDVPTL